MVRETAACDMAVVGTSLRARRPSLEVCTLTMASWRDRLWKRKVEKAKTRTHRPCPKHGSIRAVCDVCGRVTCPKCGHKCQPPKPVPAAPMIIDEPKTRRRSDVVVPPRRRATDEPGPLPDKVLIPVWQIVEPLGCVAIESHVDSGAWAFVFPPRHWGMNSAGDVADRLWNHAALRLLAEPTSFRAGRWAKPDRWWVSFALRK